MSWINENLQQHIYFLFFLCVFWNKNQGFQSWKNRKNLSYTGELSILSKSLIDCDIWLNFTFQWTSRGWAGNTTMRLVWISLFCDEENCCRSWRFVCPCLCVSQQLWPHFLIHLWCKYHDPLVSLAIYRLLCVCVISEKPKVVSDLHLPPTLVPSVTLLRDGEQTRRGGSEERKWGEGEKDKRSSWSRTVLTSLPPLTSQFQSVSVEHVLSSICLRPTSLLLPFLFWFFLLGLKDFLASSNQHVFLWLLIVCPLFIHSFICFSCIFHILHPPLISI